MTVAVDTNVLLYAQRKEAPQHAAATARLKALLDAGRRVALPWPCVYEFIRVTTHARVYDRPATVEEALVFVRALLGHPAALLLSETERHADVMDRVLIEAGVTGNRIHDAHIVALMREHGIEDILTHDADFRRFDSIRVLRLTE